MLSMSAAGKRDAVPGRQQKAGEIRRESGQERDQLAAGTREAVTAIAPHHIGTLVAYVGKKEYAPRLALGWG